MKDGQILYKLIAYVSFGFVLFLVLSMLKPFTIITTFTIIKAGDRLNNKIMKYLRQHFCKIKPDLN